MAGKQNHAAPHFLFLFSLIFLILYFLFDRQSAGIFGISSILLALALGLSSWGVGLAKGLQYLRVLPLPAGKKEWLPFARWSAIAFLLSCIVTGAASLALSYLGLLDSQLVEQKLLQLQLPALVLAFTLSPFAEEALFRGYFFRKISDSLKGSKAGDVTASATGAAFSSLLFASLHFSYGSIAEIAVAFLVGLVLCLAVKKSGSLWPAIAAHAAFNFLSIAMTVLA